MLESIAWLLGTLAVYYIYRVQKSLTNNLQAARRTGLPYIVAPLAPYNRLGQIFSFIWLPIFKTLPEKYWKDAVAVLTPDWGHHGNHAIFNKFGDTFLVVSPGSLVLYTDNAEVIHQVTSKRESFPKPTEFFNILAQYGANVLTTEGAVWRLHRKVTSASFNEKNAALVFAESIKQTQGMISQWLGADGKGKKTIKSAEHDTMKLTLQIIGYVGFGLRLLWPDQEIPADLDLKLAKYSSFDPPAGHTLTFAGALAQTLECIMLLLIVPTWILKILPFQSARKAYEAQANWLQYMQEFLEDKIDDVHKGQDQQGMDIMGQLVQTSYGSQKEEDAAFPSTKKAGKVQNLTDEEIIGNAFIMIVAAHETTANTIHFAMVELATNPAAQRQLQREIDGILGTEDRSTWDFDSTINALLASMVGATINETLRLLPPVVDIPKVVSPGQNRILSLDGEKHLLAAGTYMMLTTSAVHRNPRYWPSQPSRITSADNDLDDFVPERWYRKHTPGTIAAGHLNAVMEGADSEEQAFAEESSTSSSFFRPVRGSYIPFSDGARSCLGRRIALVELVAVLSTIFRKYSVELAVDDWASDGELDAMSQEKRRAVYRKAQERSRQFISGATSLLTLKLHGDKIIPMRLVPRGEERFVKWG